jgi:predicted RNase H-like HicB family nuclease
VRKPYFSHPQQPLALGVDLIDDCEVLVPSMPQDPVSQFGCQGNAFGGLATFDDGTTGTNQNRVVKRNTVHLPEEVIVKLKVILEPSDDGGYTVTVPSLPGCISEGDTKDEALNNIHEAIELYLESVEDDLPRSSQSELLEIAV